MDNGSSRRGRQHSGGGAFLQRSTGGAAAEAHRLRVGTVRRLWFTFGFLVVDCGQLEVEEGVADPGLPRRGGPGVGAAVSGEVPATGVRGGGEEAGGKVGGCSGREGLLASGRGLRRELQGVQWQQHQGHVQGFAADGSGSHLRGADAYH